MTCDPRRRDKAYLVGEHGPELFVPGRVSDVDREKAAAYRQAEETLQRKADEDARAHEAAAAAASRELQRASRELQRVLRVQIIGDADCFHRVFPGRFRRLLRRLKRGVA